MYAQLLPPFVKVRRSYEKVIHHALSWLCGCSRLSRAIPHGSTSIRCRWGALDTLCDATLLSGQRSMRPAHRPRALRVRLSNDSEVARAKQ
jgi:hypothetical protein